jgi:hypothetical protein
MNLIWGSAHHRTIVSEDDVSIMERAVENTISISCTTSATYADGLEIMLCRVHAIFRLKLIFTYAVFWTCASSLSLTPTPSYLLPCLGLLFGTQGHYCAGLRPGNISWESCLALLSKFCFGPGRSTRSPWSADVTSTTYRKFVFACVFFFAGGCTRLGRGRHVGIY